MERQRSKMILLTVEIPHVKNEKIFEFATPIEALGIAAFEPGSNWMKPSNVFSLRTHVDRRYKLS